jgi:protein gp37
MTKIEWTDETWNPWWGCDKIGPQCGLLAPGNPMPEGGGCYAAIFASRGLHSVHAGVAAKGEWTGLSGPRVWQAPFKYRPGTLCFTRSMSDFWHEAVPPAWRAEALDVIEATPWVTYLILTKRPAMALRQLADLGRRWPDNAWCGVTVGHPKSLPLLNVARRIPAPKRFISGEPLLAPMVPGLTLDGF